MILDGEMGIDDESKLVTSFLHFDTVSKGELVLKPIHLHKQFLILGDQINRTSNAALTFCFSAQEAPECFGCYRLQSGGA